jgi:hypothetical protein
MTGLLIAFILCLIIGPILLILPSPRQKEQMAFRREAMNRAITVELSTIDDIDPDPEKYLSSLGKALPRVIKCIAYRHSRKRPAEWRRLPRVNWKLVRRTGNDNRLPAGWDWQDTDAEALPPKFRESLISKLEELPADVLCLEETGYMVSLYWREQGGTDAMHRVCEFLESLSQVENDPIVSGDE